MYDRELPQRIQTLQQRVGKFPNELQTEALKFVLLNQFVQVDVQQFKYNTHMIAKDEIIEPATSYAEEQHFDSVS